MVVLDFHNLVFCTSLVEKINFVIRMNLFRLVHFVRQRLMRLWHKNYQRGSLAPSVSWHLRRIEKRLIIEE
jgi:hypothetical protein